MASAAGVRVSKSGPDIRVLQGFRCLRGVRGLVARLHEHCDHRNRLLHYDEYAVLLLFYFFNATVTSLRSLQRLTGFEKVRRELGIRRTSLGSLSEASQVFDPELLRGIFEDLAGRAVAKDALRHPAGLPGHLDVIATDGTILEALPRMVWARSGRRRCPDDAALWLRRAR